MSLDIIKLLPDSVANQIAAGEVVQRPASAVKELMENAIDAGATQIELTLKEAGKSLIMICDNGCGMSETDARLCFERHATSKITKADDLFAIRTMGFRGEALASIAAIAQVELKTRRAEDEVGTKVCIEGSQVNEQTLLPMEVGTVIAVKNLFFNVPARRNFLKSNAAELRHVIDEFTRVALMHPDVAFILNNDGKELFHLYSGTLKQRIVGLFGKEYESRILSVKQETDSVSINGFVVKPEFARKTRGDQFMFVNTRFIKSPYLHHAIEAAFQEMISKDSFPGYFLNITINPAEIDINIHPTKTEVNFQDAKIVYAILHASVRKAVGQNNLSPVIDFEDNKAIDIDFGEACKMNRPVVMPTIDIDETFNPFDDKQKNKTTSTTPQYQSRLEFKKPQGDWRKLYGERVDLSHDDLMQQPSQPAQQVQQRNMYVQLQHSYILTVVKSGVMLVDQHLAHTRILYEKYLKLLENHKPASQQELFPMHITLNANDASLLHELKPDLESIGFNIENMNANNFVVNGIPSDSMNNNAVEMIEKILEEFKNNQINLQLDKRLNLARSLSSQMSIGYGCAMSELEMQNLVDQLFACSVAEVAPNGKKTFVILNIDEIKTRFN